MNRRDNWNDDGDTVTPVRAITDETLAALTSAVQQPALSNRLEGKEYSPLVLRRYSTPFLHWVAVICDSDLSRLDEVVTGEWARFAMPDAPSIQDMRNLCGSLCERVSRSFANIEGVAVILSADKMLVSSLYGDFMVHAQCRLELYSLLYLSTNV